MGEASRVYSRVIETPRVYKAVGADTATAVLTYPVVDAEGEFIQPDGGDWSKYPLNPVVNWHHAEPIGRGEVTLKAVDLNGKRWVVPVGAVRFAEREEDFKGLRLGRYSPAECLHVAQQAKALVLADIATGVSIELEPIEKRVLGKSILKGTAYHYSRWAGLGWAHTLPGQQVNPGAMTIEKALEIGRSGKLPGGEALLPAIRKAFEPLLSTRSRPTQVTVPATVGKSMDQYPEPTEPAGDMPVEDPNEQKGTATARAAYNLAQGASDLIAACEADMKDGEHVKGKAKLAKQLEKLKALAEEVSAIGDMVAKDVDQGGDEGGEDEEGDDGADPDDVEEKALTIKPLKKSLDGALETAIGYTPPRFRRFKAGDLKPVEDPAPPRKLSRRLDRCLTN